MRPKIVRDKIPEIIMNAGKKPVTEIVPITEAIDGLHEKLSEELVEYLEDYSLEEMADLLEVMHGILFLKGIPWETLEAIRLQKRKERGGFEQRIRLKDILEE